MLKKIPCLENNIDFSGEPIGKVPHGGYCLYS